MTPIGTRLKQWRTERSLSLSGLAIKAGIGKATLSRWEAGKTLPRIAELEAVLAALSVSSARRQEALLSLEAPRALQRLRESEPDVPLSGDLLRAMRLRRRRTQAEVASEVGISRATLAKWEATEDWPSAQRLHALCYVLCAQEEEVVALTRGQTVFPPQPSVETTWEAYWPRIVHTVYGVEAPRLGDLVFYCAESDLWKATGATSSTDALLARVYAYHARWLSEFGRDREAKATAQWAMRRVGARAQPQDDWLGAAVTLARSLTLRGRLAEAIRLLRDHLLQARTPGYRAWLAAELAGCLSRAGAAEAALRLSRQAAQLARQEAPVEEFWFRRYDHAEILLRSGQPAEALKWLPLDPEEPPTRFLAARLPLTARTLLALGSVGEAQAYLERAGQLAESYGLTHLQEEVQAVVAQYERSRSSASAT
jgi:transcriptional regulator with XRE-family HTH domain